MADRIVLDGEMSLNNVLDGDVSLNLQCDGEFGNVIKVRENLYPIYDGVAQVVPSEEEQVLQTANKTLMEDITVFPFIWNFLGKEVEYLGVVNTITIALKDTGFNTWTPSTSATRIVETGTMQQFTGYLTQYEYFAKWQCSFTAAYTQEATLKSLPIRSISEFLIGAYKRPSANTIDSIETNSYDTNISSALAQNTILKYYDKNGAVKYAYNVSYGIYPAVTQFAFGATMADIVTISNRTPTWSARCSATYMDVARVPELDKENSIIKMRCDLYRVPVGSIMRRMFKGAVDLFNNPI